MWCSQSIFSSIIYSSLRSSPPQYLLFLYTIQNSLQIAIWVIMIEFMPLIKFQYFIVIFLYEVLIQDFLHIYKWYKCKIVWREGFSIPTHIPRRIRILFYLLQHNLIRRFQILFHIQLLTHPQQFQLIQLSHTCNWIIRSLLLLLRIIIRILSLKFLLHDLLKTLLRYWLQIILQ